MKVKSIISLFVVMAFTLDVAGLSLAVETKEVSGIVTKIAVTVKDKAGKETTVEVKDAGNVTIGVKVTIQDGEVALDVLHTRKPANPQ
jgi:hypothetical protein